MEFNIDELGRCGLKSVKVWAMIHKNATEVNVFLGCSNLFRKLFADV